MKTFTEPDGSTLYMNDRWQLDRADGPAVDRKTEQEWYSNGLPHREDGPARLFRPSLKAEWWMQGKYLYSAILPEDLFSQYWR